MMCPSHIMFERMKLRTRIAPENSGEKLMLRLCSSLSRIVLMVDRLPKRSRSRSPLLLIHSHVTCALNALSGSKCCLSHLQANRENQGYGKQGHSLQNRINPALTSSDSVLKSGSIFLPRIASQGEVNSRQVCETKRTPQSCKEVEVTSKYLDKVDLARIYADKQDQLKNIRSSVRLMICNVRDVRQYVNAKVTDKQRERHQFQEESCQKDSIETEGEKTVAGVAEATVQRLGKLVEKIVLHNDQLDADIADATTEQFMNHVPNFTLFSDEANVLLAEAAVVIVVKEGYATVIWAILGRILPSHVAVVTPGDE